MSEDGANTNRHTIGLTATTLIEGVKARNQESWQILVRLYGPMVFAWCRKGGLQNDDAGDVVQEVFRSVANSVLRFQRQTEQQGAFRGWLWTVTRSKIQDHFRRQAKRPQAFGGSEIRERINEVPDLEIDDSEQTIATEMTGVVGRAVQLVRPEFNDRTWQSFWRVAIEGHATDDVAKDLQTSTAAVRQSNYRVRKRLREVLQDVMA